MIVHPWTQYGNHGNNIQAYRNDSSSCAHGANIQHENFSFAQFLHFALFLTTLRVTYCTS